MDETIILSTSQFGDAKKSTLYSTPEQISTYITAYVDKNAVSDKNGKIKDKVFTLSSISEIKTVLSYVLSNFGVSAVI